MGPKSRILEIWNRSIFGFQEKIPSYGLEIRPFSRIWFSRIGRGRQILENEHPFSREIGSLENRFCVTWSGFWLCPRYLWLLILVVVEQIYDRMTRRLVARRVAPAARVILSQTQAFRDGDCWWKRWRTGSRYRCRCHDAIICGYSRDLARSYFKQGPHSSEQQQFSSRKCTPNDIPRRVRPQEEIQWVGFT